jgi:hypothetical protein
MNTHELIENDNLTSNNTEIRKAAKLAAHLLQVSDNQSIALLLGLSSNASNVEALHQWISNYISNNPDRSNFKDHVYPALIDTLNALNE